MSYLFDSSAIFAAVKFERVDVVSGNYTLDLTKYELGNILWKESILHRRIDMEDSKRLIKIIKDITGLTKVLKVDCHEEEILNAASKFEITFYDASYAYYTKEMGLTLITEDTKLLNKLKPHVKVSSIQQIH